MKAILVSMMCAIALMTVALAPVVQSADMNYFYAESLTSTYANQFAPTTNFGLADFLYAQSLSPAKNTRLYVNFSGLPSNAFVHNAHLRLWTFGNGAGDGIFNHLLTQQITESWTEGTLTWNNKPDITSSQQTSLGPLDFNGFMPPYRDFDVTGILNSIVRFSNPEPMYGFSVRLLEEEESPVSFESYFSDDHIFAPDEGPQLFMNWTESIQVKAFDALYVFVFIGLLIVGVVGAFKINSMMRWKR